MWGRGALIRGVTEAEGKRTHLMALLPGHENWVLWRGSAGLCASVNARLHAIRRVSVVWISPQ